MTREIKFRAWDTANHEMYQIGTLTFEKQTGNLAEMANDDPIMQFTGLQDKNGTDIYDGDILGGEGYRNCPVQWCDDLVGWEWWDGYIQSHINSYALYRAVSRVGVIGNIHENPELLT